MARAYQIRQLYSLWYKATPFKRNCIQFCIYRMYYDSRGEVLGQCMGSVPTCIIVFLLMGWSSLPNALRPFKIYCAPPNLGITRT